MQIYKNNFDAKLKKDAAENGFTVEGNYLVYNSNCNLLYSPIPNYTLGDLMTANPLSSYTKLNKDLLLRLNDITDQYGGKLEVSSTYRSFEYNLTVPGSCAVSKHCRGDALHIHCPDVNDLYERLLILNPGGEIGVYDWGFHIGIAPVPDYWDSRPEQTFARKWRDYLEPDRVRNYGIIALLGLFAIWILGRLFK